jgi:hypothetical protein
MVKKCEVHLTVQLLEAVQKMREDDPSITAESLYRHFFPLQQISFSYFYHFLRGSNVKRRQLNKPAPNPKYAPWKTCKPFSDAIANIIIEARKENPTITLDEIGNSILTNSKHPIWEVIQENNLKKQKMDGHFFAAFVRQNKNMYDFVVRKTLREQKEIRINNKKALTNIFLRDIEAIQNSIDKYDGRLYCNKKIAVDYNKSFYERGFETPKDYTHERFIAWLSHQKYMTKLWNEEIQSEGEEGNKKVVDYVVEFKNA